MIIFGVVPRYDFCSESIKGDHTTADIEITAKSTVFQIMLSVSHCYLGSRVLS